MGMMEIGPHDEIKKLYNTPANKRLKRWALAAILIAIALMLAMIFLMDSLSDRCILFMRGCTGLFALVFAILYTILVYRVNREYIKRRK